MLTMLSCCRLFAASLQLVNGGNIDFDTVSSAATPQLLVHNLLMQDRQKDFLAPSHHARKVTVDHVAVCEQASHLWQTQHPVHGKVAGGKPSSMWHSCAGDCLWHRGE